MSRDKILGLALGILVLGFTGAFCFRPEQGSDDPIPQLNNPAKLDRRIAEKPVMPYLTGVEGVDPSSANATRENPLGRPVNEPPLWRKPGFLSEGDSRPSRQSGSQAMSQVPPDPIPPVQSEAFSHNTAWQPPAKRATQPKQPARQPASYTQRTHQVERGETLSELAVRYLGNSARYMELYEANSDILANPHNLRPGMIIRIPDAQTAQGGANGTPARPVSTGGGMRDSGVELLPSPPDTGAVERFQPVRHSPLMPRGGSRTSQNDSSKPPVKRLTQLPPTGFPGIDNLLSIINGALHEKAAEAIKRSAAAQPDGEPQTR